MKTKNITLPAIPYLDVFGYKHYYIVQDKELEETFYLYLLQYEPVSFEVSSNNLIIAYQKYGKPIAHRAYSYKVGQDKWVTSSRTQYYNESVNAIVYNNFALDLKNEYYKKNSMPGDKVRPALEPQFPQIPYLHNFQYKHYYIVQDKSVLERYYLYILDYEPVNIDLDDNNYIIGYQKYGKPICYYRYSYSVGQKGWTSTSGSGAWKQNHSVFVDALIYNNFAMDFGEENYEANPLPEDQVVPALEPNFAGIPFQHNFRNKHYYIIQDKTVLERYYLYILDYEPVSLQLDDNDCIIGYQKYGKPICYYRYSYSVGQVGWTSTSGSGAWKQNHSVFVDALIYNNFAMDFGEENYEANPLPEDQVVPALEPNFAGIPFQHNFRNKHYYIIQDKVILEKYYLYILDYEPVSLELDDNDCIIGYQKYGKPISCYRYSYSVGQAGWTYTSGSGAWKQNYSVFVDALIYNNFVMDFGGEHYEANPLPEDQVVPALEPNFAGIPLQHNFRNKHYYIIQDKVILEKYYLYILDYEPVSLELDDNDCIVGYRKYGKPISCYCYSYNIGQAGWTYTLGGGVWKQNHSVFVDALIYNNFAMDFGEEHYEANPLPEDQVVPALEPNFVGIPFQHNFRYKHYYIIQDKIVLEKYYLYILDYEPVSLELDDNDCIIGYRKYGKPISCYCYSYSIGQAGWTYTSGGGVWKQNHSIFIDALIYNNFAMDFGEEHYEANPLLEDQVVPALEPNFAGIPFQHNFQYKHYYIIQDKVALENYYLYILDYEPVSLELDDNDCIIGCQKYGKPVCYRRYSYSIGQAGWTYTSGSGTWRQSYSTFIGALVYNNFAMEFGNEYYKEESLQEDQMIPALKSEFPSVPIVNGEENTYRHYIMIQDPDVLEKNILYLLKDEPVGSQVVGNEQSNVQFLNREGQPVEIRNYSYVAGTGHWSYSSTCLSLSIDLINKSSEYNNFNIQIVGNKVKNSFLSQIGNDYNISEIDIRSYLGDGTAIDPPANGWKRKNGKTYYYENGRKIEKFSGWLQLGDKYYYLDRRSNYARLENEFKKIDKETYYFNENGVMVTSEQIINGETYFFDVYGRLITVDLEYTIPFPEELNQILTPLEDFISIIERLENAYKNFNGPVNPSDAKEISPIKEILHLLKYYNYTDAMWQTVLGSHSAMFQQYIEGNYPELLNELKPYIIGDNPELFSDGNGGVLDVAHLAATTIAYAYGVILPIPVSWTGWAGDLISVMVNVKTHLEVEEHKGDNPQLAADAFLGTKPYKFNYADVCTDADAIKLAQIIKKADIYDEHGFSNILREYYANHANYRMQYYLEDMKYVNPSVDDIYKYLEGYMAEIPQQIATIFLNKTKISREIQQACWKAFAKYICASLTKH